MMNACHDLWTGRCTIFLHAYDVSQKTAQVNKFLPFRQIKMNTRREYTDPIHISYIYAGGGEGSTTVVWLRERRHNNNEFEARNSDFAT